MPSTSSIILHCSFFAEFDELSFSQLRELARGDVFLISGAPSCGNRRVAAVVGALGAAGRDQKLQASWEQPRWTTSAAMSTDRLHSFFVMSGSARWAMV
jgi:hypothetical protein